MKVTITIEDDEGRTKSFKAKGPTRTYLDVKSAADNAKVKTLSDKVRTFRDDDGTFRTFTTDEDLTPFIPWLFPDHPLKSGEARAQSTASGSGGGERLDAPPPPKYADEEPF